MVAAARAADAGPMKRFTRHLHTNGPLAVAIVALIVAMGGSAVAASLITGKQIKDGTIQPRDLSKTARAHLSGTRGPAGPQGAAGPAGAQGPQGVAGATGDPGRSALTPLQSGETIAGGWTLDTQAAAAPEDHADWNPFPVPAPAAVDGSHVRLAGNGNATMCTGTAADPTAPPGYACVYVGAKTTGATLYAGPGVQGEAEKHGFKIVLIATAPGDLYAQGSWAYTAP